MAIFVCNTEVTHNGHTSKFSSFISWFFIVKMFNLGRNLKEHNLNTPLDGKNVSSLRLQQWLYNFRYTKIYWVVHFRWVGFIACALYLNKELRGRNLDQQLRRPSECLQPILDCLGWSYSSTLTPISCPCVPYKAAGDGSSSWVVLTNHVGALDLSYRPTTSGICK